MLLQNVDVQTTLWVDKYKPKKIMDLAVHAKKIQEVTSWINKQSIKKNSPSILLITGPPGSCKTATLFALENVIIYSWNDEAENTKDIEDFTSFLFKSSRYDNIENVSEEKNSATKIILIESFPNQFHNDPNLLHNLLIRYKAIGHCPLVIIISDSQILKYSPHWLIPKTLQNELNIDNISFNSISFTQMKKAIQIIAKKENKFVNEKELVEIITNICNISNGDIRSAINNLQMIMAGRNLKKNVEMNKDSPLYIFRALGKILYCKRSTNESEIDKLKQKLQTTNPGTSIVFRAPLLFEPEDVFENSGLDYSVFVNYLHENYLDFIENIDDVDKISEDFSYSDFLYNRWMPDCKDLFGQYLISTVSRSLCFNNESHSKNTWRPLRKSCAGDLYKKISQIRLNVIDLADITPDIFSLRDLLCFNSSIIQTLPYLMKIARKDNSYSKLRTMSIFKNLEYSKRKVETGEILDDHMAVDDYECGGITNWKKEDKIWTVCKNVNEDNVYIEIDSDY